MHRMLQICNNPHPDYNCNLFIELGEGLQLKKIITKVFLFQLQQFDYEV